MNPWELLLNIIGWSLVGIVAIAALVIVWAVITSIPKSIREVRQKRRSRSQTIFKSPDK